MTTSFDPQEKWEISPQNKMSWRGECIRVGIIIACVGLVPELIAAPKDNFSIFWVGVLIALIPVAVAWLLYAPVIAYYIVTFPITGLCEALIWANTRANWRHVPGEHWAESVVTAIDKPAYWWLSLFHRDSDAG